MWILFGMAALAADETSGTVGGRFGKGVTLTTPDETLSLTIRGRIQARATLLDAPGEGLPITEMQIRRARLTFQGYAGTKDLTYTIQLAFSNLDQEADLRTPLRDAFFTWEGARDANLRVGQTKVPFGRQRVVSSGAQQFVDRSIVVGELNLDRDVGIQVRSADLGGLDGRLGYAVGVFGGDGRNRLATDFGLLGAARVEVRPMGAFEDYVEGSFDDEDPKLSIGLSAAYNQNTNRHRSTFHDTYAFATFDYLSLGADLMFKWHGTSAVVEGLRRDADTDAITEGDVTEYSRSASGFYAQAGQRIGPHAEFVGRYGMLVPDEGTDPELERLWEVGGGFNWYFDKHALKIQSDYFYLPKGSFDVGSHQVRVQTQLAF